MIDRTLLTEAAADGVPYPHERELLREAARLLLDFPTDEQVEAMRVWLLGNYDMAYEYADDPYAASQFDARAALEAVRDTMIADA